MSYFFLIFFIICLFVPIYSYVIFPWLMKQKANKLKPEKNNYSIITDWPAVTIVFSVFNEESVISKKLESLIHSDYPTDKLQILIGSDNSTDKTNAIIEEYIAKYSYIKLILF
jgi:biofilm PGA synthesis N-glycosyltransferase PgaC